MKRIYILLLACMGAMSVMAQGQKLKNLVINKDYYPVDSAKVTVKGTNISTFTDKDGKFVLEDVPLILDSIEIQKRDKSYSAEIPVRIHMRKEVMDRFSWLVRVGWEYPLYDFDNVEYCKGSRMFFVGAGYDLRLSRHLSFQPSVNLSIRKMNGCDYCYYDDEDYYYGDQTYDAGALEVPLQLALKFPVGSSTNIVFHFGAYVDVGLWGSVKVAPYSSDDWHEEKEFGIYDNTRVGGGALYGLGVEFGRFMVGAVGHSGWLPNEMTDGAGYTSFGLEIGYKFW